MGVTTLYSSNYPSVAKKMIQIQIATNRRRSFKRRRLEGVCSWFALALLCVSLQQNVAETEAVPMDSGFMRIPNNRLVVGAGGLNLWHHRMARDIAVAAALQSSSQQLQQQQQQQQQAMSSKENVKDALMQGSSTEITLDQQPQGQCLLDGEYVPETTVFCEKQVGCRAIQKTGHCCPDYKCDCQKDGKTYLNGDKLVDPETPCTVCYCQGGEILCSSVTCFHRDDCTPKYIPGVCCPEYDNCPVATSESSVNKTLTTTSTTVKPEMPAAENNPKITIKEITKPTEIRITDDNKAIPIHQMLKPTTTTTTTSSSTTSTTTTISTTTPPPPAAISTTPTTVLSATDTPALVDAIKAAVLEKLNEENVEKFSADTNPNGNGNAAAVKGGINSGDTLKLTASVAYPSSASITSTAAPLESSVEVDDPVPALSIFSTQGLPEDPSKVNIKREYFITTEGVAASASQFYDGSGEFPNSELIYSGPSSPTQQSLGGLQPSSAELDPDTAGSDNIYHIILTTDGPRLTATSENYLALKGISSTEGPFEDLASSSLAPFTPLDMSSVPSTTEAPDSAKDDYYIKSSTESSMHQHLEEDEIPAEINPAYPSLPADDFSIRGDNNYQLSDNDDIGEEPRSIGGHGGHSSHGGSHHISHGGGHDILKNSKHLEDVSYGSGSGSGSGSGMDIMIEELVALPSSTEGSGGMDLSSKHPATPGSYDKKMKTPEIVQFMYSGEDSSEETRITNSSDFLVETTKKSEDSSMESSEILKPHESLMEFGSGSGSGAGAEAVEMKPDKEREPTTPRPYKGAASADIDELQDSSGNGPQDDPKEDAESLKLDENQADTAANADKSPKGNILSVKVQTAQQEKAFYDDQV